MFGKVFSTKKYASNLLGETLEDLLRRATAKTLDQPDEIANAQVVQAINEDTIHHPRDIIALLKRRLEMDNPQKQYLAVVLLGKILQECQGMVGPYQEELLHDVAAIMTRASRGRDALASQRAKGAARELLRSYGRTGYDAIRNAARANYNYAGARGPLPEGMEAAGVPAGVEKASLVDEVRRMAETAKGHTELLQDMLVNSGEAGVQEMERELMNELLQEVRELRAMFNPYLEQLGALEGEEVEATMASALEAVDILDNAIALQREVAVAVAEAPSETPSQPTSPVAAAPTPTMAAASSPQAIPPPAATPPSQDLIDLSDLESALPAATSPGSPQPPPPRDPFAPVASPLATSQSSPQPQAPLPATPSGPQQPPPLGLANPTNSAPYPPPMSTPPMQAPFQQQPPPFAPYSQQYTGPMDPQMQPPQFPQHPGMYPPHGMPPPLGMYPPQHTGPGMVQSPPTSPTLSGPISASSMYARPLMPPQQPPHMYSMPMAGMQGPPQMRPPPQMYAMGPPPVNPFAGQGALSFGDNAFDNPTSPPQQQQGFPPSGHPTSNPFLAPPTSQPAAPPAAASTVDRDWDLMFADKSNPQAAAAHN